MLVSTILLTSVSKFENSQKDLGFRWGLAFNFLMMKIDVCIISGSFIVNPKLVLNQNFHAIFVKGNCHWIHIHITFPFLTIRSLLFFKTVLTLMFIVWNPPPSPLFFFKWGGVNFITSTRGWRLKNKGGSMVQKQVFLKGRLALFLFNFFKITIFTFRNYFTLCKIVLYMFAKLCYAFEENHFFLPP